MDPDPYSEYGSVSGSKQVMDKLVAKGERWKAQNHHSETPLTKNFTNAIIFLKFKNCLSLKLFNIFLSKLIT